MNDCTHTSHDVSLQSLADAPSWGNRLMTLLVAMFDAVLNAQRRALERHQLASMDDHMLRDIGLSRSDVQCELGKWFWEK